METNVALSRISRMWAKLGRTFETGAYNLATSDEPFSRQKAIEYAKTAEACFWRSTGEMDAIDFGGTKI